MRFKKSVEYTPILREMEVNFELRFYHIKDKGGHSVLKMRQSWWDKNGTSVYNRIFEIFPVVN